MVDVAISSWREIFVRLDFNRENIDAWRALERRVRAKAQDELGQHGTQFVEDLVADTCSTVVMNLDNARSGDTFSAFVFGHYLNVRRRLFAASRGQVAIDGIDPPAPARAEPEVDEQSLLRQCMSELPQREREAIMIRYFGSGETSEIATTLGVSEVNARRIVFNGLARLRACARRTWPKGREA